MCLFVRHYIAQTQRQFSARNADATGNAHGLKLVKAADIQHCNVCALLLQRLHLFCGQRWRVVMMFYPFAKGFTWRIHINKDFAASFAPARQIASQQSDILITQRLQKFSGTHRFTLTTGLIVKLAIVVQRDRCATIWNTIQHVQFQLRQ